MNIKLHHLFTHHILPSKLLAQYPIHHVWWPWGAGHLQLHLLPHTPRPITSMYHHIPPSQCGSASWSPSPSSLHGLPNVVPSPSCPWVVKGGREKLNVSGIDHMNVYIIWLGIIYLYTILCTSILCRSIIYIYNVHIVHTTCMSWGAQLHQPLSTLYLQDHNPCNLSWRWSIPSFHDLIFNLIHILLVLCREWGNEP